MLEIKCPNCPVCGATPLITFAEGLQAICGSDQCDVLMWDSTMPAAWNLADMGLIDLRAIFPEEKSN
jgi:hypothetical protein